MSDKDKVKVRGVSMYQAQWDIVRKVAATYGMTDSQALRYIVRNHQPENVQMRLTAVNPAGAQS
jgi:hypothetical protein